MSHASPAELMVWHLTRVSFLTLGGGWKSWNHLLFWHSMCVTQVPYVAFKSSVNLHSTKVFSTSRCILSAAGTLLQWILLITLVCYGWGWVPEVVMSEWRRNSKGLSQCIDRRQEREKWWFLFTKYRKVFLFFTCLAINFQYFIESRKV